MPILLFFLGQSLKHLSTGVSTRPWLLVVDHFFRNNILYANELCVGLFRVVDHALVEIVGKVGAEVVGLDMAAVVVSSVTLQMNLMYL